MKQLYYLVSLIFQYENLFSVGFKRLQTLFYCKLQKIIRPRKHYSFINIAFFFISHEFPPDFEFGLS